MTKLNEFLNIFLKDCSTDLKRDIGWLTEDLPDEISEKEKEKLQEDINQLKQGKPLAYVMGYIPFYDTKISVSKNTLIPRSETELLVDLIIKKWKNKVNENTRILDLCCGSGAIAIAIKNHLNCTVDAVDINENCTQITKQNAQLNGVSINVTKSDMFKNLTDKYDLIISNPPYIEKNEIEKLDRSVKDFEPHLALDGGIDGLDFYRIISEKAPDFLKTEGEIALEIGFNQGEELKKLLDKNFKDIEVKKDYSNLPRFVMAKKRWKMIEKLKEFKDRYNYLVLESCKPENLQDMEKWKKITKEQSELEEYANLYDKYIQTENNFKSAKEVLAETTDAELKEMAQEEVAMWENKLQKLNDEVKLALLPKDSRDDSKVVILEIRSGAGGDESSLFGGELFNMYKKYAEKQGWKVEITEYNETEVGGIREAVMIITGKGAYKRLKFESGVHRVQRVPETESQGRVHTSTTTVAVLPEVEEVDFVIEEKDLRVDTFRSAGCGGQGVNTTDSAVRLTHLPTGMVVTCQDERSQIKNREKALNILKAKLHDFYEEKAITEHQQERKAQVGTGDRSERIRTYNFPQGRVTDHRIGLSQYNINEFMLGDIDSMLDALHIEDQKIKLENASKQ